jgi:hypothetical protein
MINELADEAANVGLIAVSEDPKRVLYRFLDDPTVKSRSDVRVQRDVVERFKAGVEARIDAAQRDPIPPDAFTRTVLGSVRELGGNLMRATLPHSVLTNDMDKEFDLLFQQWVAPVARSRVVRQYAPRDPLKGLKKEATRAVVEAFRSGYGPLGKRTVLKQYEISGKLHKSIFDLAVRVGPKRDQIEKVFQHLLVLPDAEDTFTQAAGLVWRWSDIEARNSTKRTLTAVLYGRRVQRLAIRDASKLLKQQDIELAHVSDLPKLARELQEQRELL